MEDAMNADEAVREGLIGALGADAAFSGVAGLGLEPTAGSLPQVDVAWPLVSDWGTKSQSGRELRTLVTLRVAKGQRARLPAMVAAVEAAGASLGGVIDGWSVGSAVLMRTQTSDERDGVRVARVEHRIRVLKN
jgi:hypothetical protein